MDEVIGKRILIIGSGGSGKSTLSLELHKLLELPLIHLDNHYWNAGWVKTPKDEWLEKVKVLISNDKWIIDGNFLGSLNLRLERADTVIFLDFNRFICVHRVFKRWKKYKNKTRPDMAKDCPEKIDAEFIKWVWTFNKKVRPLILQALSGHPNATKIILRRPKDVKNFLAKLKG